MKTVTVTTEVDVDIDDILDRMSEDEIKEAFAKRLSGISDIGHVSELYEAYRLKQQDRFEQLLRNLFFNALGRIV